MLLMTKPRIARQGSVVVFFWGGGGAKGGNHTGIFFFTTSRWIATKFGDSNLLSFSLKI